MITTLCKSIVDCDYKLAGKCNVCKKNVCKKHMDVYNFAGRTGICRECTKDNPTREDKRCNNCDNSLNEIYDRDSYGFILCRECIAIALDCECGNSRCTYLMNEPFCHRCSTGNDLRELVKGLCAYCSGENGNYYED